ncbi:MAG: Asp-tRNA(Asn)/Glu-tRNA(Gln) amidotransferase subunit GatB, partial [Nocardiopsaceae bacterium]|nr:Asp-tRNA(Asn)/Glu-tRNA(Gln) amidotransferase subunit GatB [Nocardiopsaceae bacterium]
MTQAPLRTVAFDEAVARYDPVIGLETHVELGTRSKMFCGCPTVFGAEPNSAVCPVCLGLPGSLPVINKAAIEYTIRIGLALNCSIASWCRFARKNYFYPDMPKNYQISQYDEPLCTDGWLDIEVGEQRFRIGIERVHLEEDTGKSLHVGGSGRIHGADYSLVDYNRAGIPLVEVVTKPIPGTGALAPAVARAYVTELRDLMRALDVSDVRMEQGSLRCDVNTSLTPAGSAQWGTRTETKNVNSLRSVERAVRSEIERQAAILDDSGRVVQETRHFHEQNGVTTAGRSKEEAQDYRYFPEPDLVPIEPAAEWVKEIGSALPELPSARRARLQSELGLSGSDMTALRNAGALELVAETVAAGASPEQARNWWLSELSGRANAARIELGDLAVSPAQVARISALVDSGELSNRLARQVLDGVLAGEGSPDEVVAARGLAVVTDTDVLAAAVDEAIAANPEIA